MKLSRYAMAFALALGLSVSLSACGKPESSPAQIAYANEAAVDVALKAGASYAKQPRCVAEILPTCSTPALIHEIRVAADNAAASAEAWSNAVTAGKASAEQVATLRAKAEADLKALKTALAKINPTAAPAAKPTAWRITDMMEAA